MAISLGPIRLDRPLARGGMGEVWDGRLPNGRSCAVKLVHTTDPAVADALRAEARAIAGLHHPHIVRVFDYGKVPEGIKGLVAGTPYLAMERAAGTLLDIEKELDWGRCKQVLSEVLDALAHAHARGVVHRDLKPANVLRFVDGTFKLTDFGIAHVMGTERKGLFEPPRGTGGFAAPEQVRGAFRDQGSWTDLYAVGCLAWRLVTGSGFSQETEFEPRFSVPSHLHWWIRSLTVADIFGRVTFAADAAWELSRLGPADLDGTKERPGRSPSLHTLPLTWFDEDALEPLPAADAVTEETLFGRPPCPTNWATRSFGSPRVINIGHGIARLRTLPFIGRESERTALWQHLLAVHQTRRARLVVLDGPAGIGKSALVRWLEHRAHETGAAWTMEGQGSGPTPLETLIRTLFHGIGLGTDALADRIESRMRHWGLPDDVIEDVVGIGIGRGDAIGSFGQLLQWFGQDRPVVLALDDLQDAPELLTLVERLVPGERRSPIPLLVVAATDMASIAHEHELSNHIAALDAAERIAMGPLDPNTTRNLASTMLGLDPVLAARVEQTSRGNPRTITQTVGHWVQSGDLVDSPSGLTLRDPTSFTHPTWEERLAALFHGQPSRVCDAMRVMALGGLTGHQRVTRRVLDQLGLPWPDALIDAWVDQGLLHLESGSYTFLQGPLQEVLVNEAGADRQTWHLAWANALDDDPAGSLVHRVCGGELDVLPQCLQALDRLRVRHQSTRALTLLADIEQATASLPHDHQSRVLVAIARIRALSSRGNVGEARTQLEALVTARGDEVTPLLPFLHIFVHVLVDAGFPARARELFDAWRPRLRDPADQLKADVAELRLLFQAGRPREAASAFDILRPKLKQASPPTMARARLHGGYALLFCGRAREALDLFRAGERALRDQRDSNWRSTLGAIGSSLTHLGEFEEAAMWFELGRGVVARHGDRLAEADLVANLADTYRQLGRLDEAAGLFDDVLAIREEFGQSAFFERLNLALLLQLQGDERGAMEMLRPAIAEAPERGGAWIGVASAVALPLVLRTPEWSGHFDRVLKHLEPSGLVDKDVAWSFQRALDEGRALRFPEVEALVPLLKRQYEALGETDRLATLTE